MGKHIPIHQIVCVDKNGGIGKNGDLPWKIEGDWQYFLNKTLEIQVMNGTVHITLLVGQFSWFYVLNVPFTQCCFTT